VRSFILFVPLLASCAPAPVGAPTLCQLAEAREDYVGQTVTVEGFLLVSDHGSVVTDPRCGYGMGITGEHGDLLRMKGLDAVAKQLTEEPIMVRVRVTGEVRQDRAESMIGGKGWHLDLVAADVLSAERIAQKDAHRYLRWLEGPSPEPYRQSR
jgi:hypothetical protein